MPTCKDFSPQVRILNGGSLKPILVSKCHGNPSVAGRYVKAGTLGKLISTFINLRGTQQSLVEVMHKWYIMEKSDFEIVE